MRLVVKIGSNILTTGALGLNEKRIGQIVKVINEIILAGHEVIIVSSGAVAAGMRRLGIKDKPTEIMLKQAAAAVGQPALMWAYERCFNEYGRKTAQVLLTRDALSDRTMYLNSKNTLATLLKYGIVPVINENDTVATDEIKFGDNDQLAALVSGVVEADRLVILSDVDGFYEENPRTCPSAKIIPLVNSITDDLLRRAGGSGSAVGTGGMYSKLLAAKKAMRLGVTVNIINGKKPTQIVDIISGKSRGTEFRPAGGKLSARKGWIAFGIRPKGTLLLDAGAAKALAAHNRSLLPSGIVGIEGEFKAGEAVYCVDSEANRIAKGLTNYSSDDIRRIMGRRTSEIAEILGYQYSEEVIHRDNMVSLAQG